MGIDFSKEMIAQASSKYPNIQFLNQDIHTLELEEKFDYIIFSDVINSLWDLQKVLKNIKKNCKPNTKIIFNYLNHFWRRPFEFFSSLGLISERKDQNWFTRSDLNNLFQLTDYETINAFPDIIFPFKIPLFNQIDKFFSKIPPFSWLSITNFLIAKPIFQDVKDKEYEVSVVIAARNEEGHIDELVSKIPKMGSSTEIIFIEGNSKDKTADKIKLSIKKNPEKNMTLLTQTGEGKGDAIRLGLDKAKGDILMILDADISVPPEDLKKFYEAISKNKGEFINGVRLVYPMEKAAMRFLNLLANKFFAITFSWLLGQNIRDTLCGTKVFFKEDYIKIKSNRNYFGDFDPFGDFDLLLGAAKLNLKILEIPIRYKARKYGETNISRWAHGLMLLKMLIFSAIKIKFI